MQLEELHHQVTVEAKAVGNEFPRVHFVKMNKKRRIKYLVVNSKTKPIEVSIYTLHTASVLVHHPPIITNCPPLYPYYPIWAESTTEMVEWAIKYKPEPTALRFPPTMCV
jgi:hypothetical protein